MVNNVIHNNEGYGVVLVKPTIFSDLQENAQDGTEGKQAVFSSFTVKRQI